MTTPVMEVIHDQYPEALIDIVADRRSSDLLKHCPYLGRLIHRDKNLGWTGSWKLVRRLREQHYDLVVDLRTDGIAWLLRARRRLTRLGRRLETGHAIVRHMAIIKKSDQPTHIPPTRIWLSKTQQNYAIKTLSGLSGGRWLAIGPGANWGPKRWPAHHYHELVRQLSPDFDAVVCLGNAADEPYCNKVIDELTIQTLNLAGKTSLLQAAAVLRHMQLFIGNDSGLGHVAAAMGIPTFTVFGPGEPRRYHPWGPSCDWIQSSSRRIEDLAPADVAKLARDLLSASAI